MNNELMDLLRLMLGVQNYQINKMRQSQEKTKTLIFDDFCINYAYYAKLTTRNMTNDITKSMRPFGAI